MEKNYGWPMIVKAPNSSISHQTQGAGITRCGITVTKAWKEGCVGGASMGNESLLEARRLTLGEELFLIACLEIGMTYKVGTVIRPCKRCF